MSFPSQVRIIKTGWLDGWPMSATTGTTENSNIKLVARPRINIFEFLVCQGLSISFVQGPAFSAGPD
jgi:hypothetical protein